MSVLRSLLLYAAACGALWLPVSGHAESAPDLDLSIRHYSRVMSDEGVLRESRHEDRMLRRDGHVWLYRVLPTAMTHHHDEKDHRHFNPVLLPRHVTPDGARARIEFIDFHERELISIPQADHENVGFDGSWQNAFYLADPKRVMAMPVSGRASPIAGARWREQRTKDMFQRVLWDEKRMIPLIVESGDAQGRVLERVEVQPLPGLEKRQPWKETAGFARKEYADFLD
jgi:hypothetical protein